MKARTIGLVGAALSAALFLLILTESAAVAIGVVGVIAALAMFAAARRAKRDARNRDARG